jgi:hypothetical protein
LAAAARSIVTPARKPCAARSLAIAQALRRGAARDGRYAPAERTYNLKYSAGMLAHGKCTDCIELYGTRVVPLVRQLLA